MKKTILVSSVFVLCFAKNGMTQIKWTTPDVFLNTIIRIEATSNQKQRYQNAIAYFSDTHATSKQLQDACFYLKTDQEKYELCYAAYPNIIDKGNFINVYNSFSAFSTAIKLFRNTEAKDELLSVEYSHQLVNEQDRTEKLNLLMHQGDVLLSVNKFAQAISAFEQAMRLNPNDPTPKSKIKEVRKWQQELLGVTHVKNANNTKFDALIRKGDHLLASELYDQAVLIYEDAMALNPRNKTAYARIKEANRRMALETQKNIEFNDLIEQGDRLLADNQLDESISIYEKAMLLKTSDNLAYLRIKDVFNIKFETVDTDYQPVVEDCFTDDAEFSYVMEAINDQSFTDDRMRIAKNYISSKCLSMKQLLEIVPVFRMDDDKLEIIKFMCDHTASIEKRYMFRDLFSFTSTKRKFDNFLTSREK